MVEIKYVGDALWDRIGNAVENVKDRLNRVTGALNRAGVPYAVIGGNAVQHWVSQVDESVVRNTRDVDIILNRHELPLAIAALEPAGFLFRAAAGVSMASMRKHAMQFTSSLPARKFELSTPKLFRKSISTH